MFQLVKKVRMHGFIRLIFLHGLVFYVYGFCLCNVYEVQKAYAVASIQRSLSKQVLNESRKNP